MVKRSKKIGAMILSVVMLGTIATTPVSASSNYVTGNMGGNTCSGNVVYAYAPGGACNGVTAKTVFNTGGTIQVKATVCYKSNGKQKTNTVSNSASGGAATVTAHNNDLGNVYGGKGWHYVKSGAYTWRDTTSIGTTW